MAGTDQPLAFESFSPEPASQFPVFHDGDVLIKLSDVRYFQLHSVTLRENSDFFKLALTEEKAAQLNRKAIRDGIIVRYRFEYQLPYIDDDEIGQLYARPIHDNGNPYGNFPPLPLENGLLPCSAYRHFTNIFAAYYHQPVIDINDTNIATVLPEIIELMAIADYLGSARVISTLLDNLLMKQGQMLFRSIAEAPIPWASLAFRLQSEIVFREAIIHAVGQWNVLSPTLNDVETYHSVPPKVMKLISQKAEQLGELKRAIECRIVGHYPLHLQRPLTLPSERPPKSTVYGGDVIGWMALSFFRHWVAQHACGDRTRHAADGGAEFYRAVAAGSAGIRPPPINPLTGAPSSKTSTPRRSRKRAKDTASYLSRTDVEGFCRYFPLSSKASNLFTEQLGIIKEAVKVFVSGLVVNNSMLDIKTYPAPYLTCTTVRRDEMPWLTPATDYEGQTFDSREGTFDDVMNAVGLGAGIPTTMIANMNNYTTPTTSPSSNNNIHTTPTPGSYQPNPRKRARPSSSPSRSSNANAANRIDSDAEFEEDETPLPAMRLSIRNRGALPVSPSMTAAASRTLREAGWVGQESLFGLEEDEEYSTMAVDEDEGMGEGVQGEGDINDDGNVEDEGYEAPPSPRHKSVGLFLSPSSSP